jgi:hypothetical protein
MATEIIIILAITGMVGLLATPPFVLWLLEQANRITSRYYGKK